jgi:hypothetical protein
LPKGASYLVGTPKGRLSLPEQPPPKISAQEVHRQHPEPATV